MPFAFNNFQTGSFSTVGVVEVGTFSLFGPPVRISEKWSPGVRVGLGWEMGECGWQLRGAWTGMEHRARIRRRYLAFHERPRNIIHHIAQSPQIT